MGIICIDGNTTAMDILQVAIKYTFDLAVAMLGDKLPPFFQEGAYV